MFSLLDVLIFKSMKLRRLFEKCLKQVPFVKCESFLFTSALNEKNYGTWHMCVDYETLNTKTIKDKFSISLIDELLDELNGARYSSKLDLQFRYH